MFTGNKNQMEWYVKGISFNDPVISLEIKNIYILPVSKHC